MSLNCECEPGYYTKNEICIRCSSENNRNPNTCQCLPGYYLSNDDCFKCNNTKCATCTGNPNNCIDPCPSECAQCEPNLKCLTCKLGLYPSLDTC